MISFESFFIEKFEFDLHANLSWTKVLEEHEDELSDYLIRSMSHIINVHHIWNSRLFNQVAESRDGDILPVTFMSRMHKENQQQSINFLQHATIEGTVKYINSENIPQEKEKMDILYHILSHSNYHRAQIAKTCRELNLPVVEVNFITFR